MSREHVHDVYTRGICTARLYIILLLLLCTLGVHVSARRVLFACEGCIQGAARAAVLRSHVRRGSTYIIYYDIGKRCY